MDIVFSLGPTDLIIGSAQVAQPDSFNLNLGTIGALLGSASYFTHLIVNGLTLGWPKRPSWLAWLAALLLGVLMTCLLSLATLPADTPWTRQTMAQIVLVGLAAGGGAAGASVTQASATAKRKVALGGQQPEPDPETQQARVPEPQTNP